MMRGTMGDFQFAVCDGGRDNQRPRLNAIRDDRVLCATERIHAFKHFQPATRIQMTHTEGIHIALGHAYHPFRPRPQIHCEYRVLFDGGVKLA